MIDREKVARAIQGASVPHKDHRSGSRSLGYYLTLGIDAVSHDIDRAPILAEKAADAAIASVLEQLQEPSEAMLEAGWFQISCLHPEQSDMPREAERECWRAMLEAAFLQPPESSNPAE